MQLRVLLLAGLILAAGMSSVDAGVMYTFSYVDSNNNTLSGQLEGVLQADNDTVIVSSITDLKFNAVSVSGPIDNIVLAATDAFTNSLLPPIVSISGSNMDLYVFQAVKFNPFVFAFDSSGTLSSSGPLYYSNDVLGNAFDVYDPGNWTLTPASVAAVPEPSSFAVLGLSALGLIGHRRRRKTEGA